MVYGNSPFVRAASVLILLMSLAGCGPTNTIPSTISKVAEAPATGSLIDTLGFIPSPKVDKKGIPIPYKMADNPYLERSGSINKTTVEQFITARRAMAANDLGTAEKLLLDILLKENKLSGPKVMLGDIEVARGELVKAEAYYLDAIATNNSNVNAYLRLAKVQRMQGGFVQAQNTYATVLALWPDFPEAHLNLGVLYDVYLNDGVKAQRHIEAYQFLTNGENQQVAVWLQELQKRTGLSANLNALSHGKIVEPVS